MYMDLGKNIKNIGEQKGLMQKDNKNAVYRIIDRMFTKK